MRVPTLVLASSSPRRLTLLRGAGFAPRVAPSGLHERLDPRRSPRREVVRLAEDKAAAVSRTLASERGPWLVLAADTEVVLDGRALGKPVGSDEAVDMLRRLAGRVHEVLTGVCLLHTANGRAASVVECTRVRFRSYPDAFITWYVGTGEPMDKAGAYGIQGRGALLVEAIEGSWTNVVGLPVEKLPELADRVGVDLLDLLRGGGASPGPTS